MELRLTSWKPKLKRQVPIEMKNTAFLAPPPLPSPFIATPGVYRSYQTGSPTGAAAAALDHSYSYIRSEPYLQPTLQLDP